MNCCRRNAFTVILVACGLSACANPQQQSQERAAALQAQANKYCWEVFSDPRLEPVKDKVPLSLTMSDPIPIQMLSNNEFATKEEAAAILVWAEQRQKCQTKYTSLFGPAPVHLDALRRANTQLMAELYGGQITYGQYAKQLNQNTALFLQQDATIRAQAARDQMQAMQAFQQTLYQQQQLNLERQRIQNEQLRAMQPQPSRSVNCTTSYIGNQAYTNCQ
jgi:hypothetical protein